MILSKAKFSSYVLAGGRSSRMGTDKALLEMKGESFLARAVKALESISENQVKVVLNRRQTHFIEKLPPQIPCLFDHYEERGALGGIHAALLDCPTELAIVLACDMPLVSSEAISVLAQVALGADEFSAVIPRQTDGKFQPLCAVYRTELCLPVIEKLLENKKSVSMRDFLALVRVLYIESNRISEDENLFLNINNPLDYELFISE